MTTNIDQMILDRFAVESSANLQEQIKVLADALSKLDQIVGEVDNAADQRYKYLLGEMQLEDRKLEDRLDAEIEGVFHVISGDQFDIKCLATRLDRLEKRQATYGNYVGACLRKIEAAIANDPRNAYLKQVLEAVEDLGSKLN